MNRLAIGAAALRPRPRLSRRSPRCRSSPFASAGALRERLPVVFHRLFLALFGVRVDRARAAAGAGGDPRSREPRLLARHPGDRLPAAALVRREIGGRGLADRRHLARLQRSVFIDRQRRRATAEVEPGGRPPPRRWRGRSCSSPKARPATATASCRSGPPSSAPPRRPLADSGRRPDRPPAARDRLYAAQRPAARPPRTAGDRLVRRHGPRAASCRLRPRRGPSTWSVDLGRADPVRRRPQAGDRARPRPPCARRSAPATALEAGESAPRRVSGCRSVAEPAGAPICPVLLNP